MPRHCDHDVTKDATSTNEAQHSPRGLIALVEATCDPIFLFQYKTFVMSEKADPENEGWEWADEYWIDADGEPVSNQTMVDRGYLVETWKTERVVGSRDEGDAYGERRSYDYPNGWRTYCVPCDGKLAKLLVQHWE